MRSAFRGRLFRRRGHAERRMGPLRAEEGLRGSLEGPEGRRHPFHRRRPVEEGSRRGAGRKDAYVRPSRPWVRRDLRDGGHNVPPAFVAGRQTGMGRVLPRRDRLLSRSHRLQGPYAPAVRGCHLRTRIPDKGRQAPSSLGSTDAPPSRTWPRRAGKASSSGLSRSSS